MLPKDIVIGLGEIGAPIYNLLSRTFPTAGYDINPKLMNHQKYEKLKNEQIIFVHICIPHSKKFQNTVMKIVKKFKPKALVIHSTISPGTTERLQKKLNIPVIYSATRGIHKRMINDMKRYTKFYSIYNWAPNSKWANQYFVRKMKKAGLKTKKMTNPLTLELAKIVVDTSYYGWLIIYSQISNVIAIKNKVDYEEMWSFSDEIHKYLGNRPKMFPGFIGGHCVIPNLDLIHHETLNLIKKLNKTYAKKIKNSKTIHKKYSE